MASPEDNNLEDTLQDAAFLRDTISSIGATIADSLNTQLSEALGLTKAIGKTVERDVNAAFLKLTRGTDKILANTIDLAEGTANVKTIANQINDLKTKEIALENLLEVARLNNLIIYDEEQESLKETLALQKTLLDAQLTQATKLQSKLGVTGGLLKGLSKIPILGNLIEAEKALSAAQTEAGSATSSRFSTMAAGLKSVGMSLGKNLLDPLVLGGLLVTGIVATFRQLDKLTSDTARNFGISNSQANELNKELSAMASTTEGLYGTTRNFNEAFTTLNKRYGTFGKFNKQTLKDFTDLTKQAGISEQAVGALQDMTFLTGKGLRESTKEYKGQVALLNIQNGLALNEAEVLEGISDISSSIKLQMGGSAAAMAQAVFKAKALGVEMKDLAATSNALLNFQSSIEDELAAELLTGKQLNLEGARYAALMGDQATLADELAANIGTAAEYGKLNVIQQEAYAKAVGMSTNSLADALIQREALNKLDAQGNTLQEKYNNLKKQGKTEAEIAKQLGDDALASQLESVSLQEKLAVAGQKFQDALLPLAEKVLPLIHSFFNFVGENIGTIIGAMKILLPLAIAYKVATIGTAIAAATINPAAAIAGLAAGAVMLGVLNSALDAGPEEGAGSTSSLGTIQAGTENRQERPYSSSNPANSTASNTQVNITPSDTKITLNLNGQAVGNANARQAYGVGRNVKALGGGVDYSATV